MESLLPLIWFLFVLAIPVAFIVIGYINYINEMKGAEIALRLLAAFAGYALITFAVFWFMFILIFAGAHTEPAGNVLDLKGKIFYSMLVLGYIFFGWLLCSLAKGSLIKPWNALNRENGKRRQLPENKILKNFI